MYLFPFHRLPRRRAGIVRPLVALLLFGVGVLAHPAPPAQSAEPPAAHEPTRRSFGGMDSSSHYVTMRDGVRIAVDVHLPKGLAAGERTATILHMSRYYRSVAIRGIWRPFLGSIYPLTERDLREDFVKAGYSWLDVDVRGSGASFGHREYPLSDDEVMDGRELLDWIVAQPWSAGVVGTLGSSYDGALAEMLARHGHPALKAIAPRFSGWDMYGDVFLPGGLPARSLVDAWATLTSALDRGRLTDVFGWTGGVVSGGVRPVDGRLLPQAMAEHDGNVDLVQLLAGVVYRDDTDPRGGPMTIDDFSPHAIDSAAAAVPVYAYGGWFDAALARGQIRQFLANGHPGSRLRIGPWFHAGEFNASPYAPRRQPDFDHAQELMRFFDAHLRGARDAFDAEPPVHYYTMGEERWKTARTWPPPGAVTTTYFFAPERALSLATATMESAADRYEVDPTATTGDGSRWGLIVGTGASRGYGDQREHDARRLTYTTPPLQDALEVTGHPVVRLFLSANAADGAVFAYLEDVRPNGEVRYVTEGQLRLIHRAHRQSPLELLPIPYRSFRRADASPVVPGEVTEATFDLLPTSFVFQPGHAIRLAIAGADAGTFDAILPDSPLVYDVHRDTPHRSRLELPTYR